MIVVGLIVGIAIGALAAYVVFGRKAGESELELRALRGELLHKDELLRTQAANHAQQVEAMRADEERLREQMTAISNSVLERTTRHLEEQLEQRQKLEREQAKNELEKRTVEIKTAVSPVTEKLAEVQKKVEELEAQRIKAQSELNQQLRYLKEGTEALASEAGGLSAALRKPMGRGSWGEVQLRRVIELAGMVEHCDFTTQVTVEGDEGRLRPDVVVHMPGGHSVVIDAKAPMEGFLEALNETDEARREEQLKRHVRHVREHVNTLRSKNYQSQFEQSPDLVVMFVPSEGIYHAALAEDSLLLEHGISEKVLIATPTTLIGLLRAIEYGWGQERIAQSAQEIAEVGRELHKRIATFSEPLAKVGRSLSTATTQYNQAVASFESRVKPQLRKMEDAGAQSSKEVPELPAVETQPREVVVEAEATELEDELERLGIGDFEPHQD